MTPCFIALGANIGKPEQQILSAVRQIDRLPETSVVAMSSLYKNPPMGPCDQPDYVNGVMRIQTRLMPLDMLDCLQEIEQQHGRCREQEQRWGARTLDLDMLLFGQENINTPRLTLPHPGLEQRVFVCYPLFEIAPDLILPSGRKLSEIIKQWPRSALTLLSSQQGNRHELHHYAHPSEL